MRCNEKAALRQQDGNRHGLSGRKDVVTISQKVSQCKQILSYLKKHRAITPFDALELYGCLRLSARIKDLRNMGYQITTDRFNGNGYAIYWLEEDR